jgi:hypothetical protein
MFVHTLILPDQYEVSIEKSHDSLSKPLEISITKTDPIKCFNEVVLSFDHTIGIFLACFWISLKRMNDLILPVDECFSDFSELFGFRRLQYKWLNKSGSYSYRLIFGQKKFPFQ